MILKGPSVQEYLHNRALTFAIVPDNTKPGSYCEAAKDCVYIIHVASPLVTQAGDLVSQLNAGNKATLEAAEATPSFKRVIFAASTANIRPFERIFQEHPANQAVILGRDDEVPALTAKTKVLTQPLLSDDAPPFHRYVNSKIAVANLVHEYGTSPRSESAHFSIVNIMPGWILGPEELAQSKQEAMKGSNLILGWPFFEVDLAPL